MIIEEEEERDVETSQYVVSMGVRTENPTLIQSQREEPKPR